MPRHFYVTRRRSAQHPCDVFIISFFKNAGYIEIGILSALAHNAGQFSVAAIMVSGESVIGYAPVLLLSALVTGAVTGSILRAVMPKLHNIDKAVKGGR